MTTVNNEANWSYDNDIDAEGDDENDNIKAPPQDGNAASATHKDAV